jgi:hypothetical protein
MRAIENPHQTEVRAAHRSGFSQPCHGAAVAVPDAVSDAATPAAPGRRRLHSRSSERACCAAPVLALDDTQSCRPGPSWLLIPRGSSRAGTSAPRVNSRAGSLDPVDQPNRARERASGRAATGCPVSACLSRCCRTSSVAASGPAVQVPSSRISVTTRGREVAQRQKRSGEASASMVRAAAWPLTPCTPPPGCTDAPAM